MKEEIDSILQEAAAIRVKDVRQAISLVEKAIQRANEVSYKEGKAQGLSQMAHYQMMLGKFDDAIALARESNSQFVELKNDLGIAETLYVKGNTYLKKGELHSGLQDLIACLKIFESNDHKKGQAKAHNSIGYVHKSFKDYKNALKSYQTNLEISKEFNDLNGQSNSYNHIAEIQLEQGQYEEGLETIDKGIPMKRETGDKRGLGIGLHTKGILLAKLHNREEALKALTEALEINKEVNDSYQIALCNMSIGAIHVEKENADTAKIFIEKALSCAEQINAKEIIYTCEHHLYTIAELSSNYETALLHFKRYNEVKEEVINQEKNLKVKNIQLEYQVELAEKMKSKNEELKQAHEELAEQHKSISDSIKYAERLQLATLPAPSEVNKRIRDNFILFKPKDVVSGDFYWFEHANNINYIAAADCTGHGVPGALVSVVCSNALNRCVNEFGINDPAKILDKTRELVIETFAKSGDGVKDGMDIALCAFTENKVVYAGANNPLWIVRKTSILTEDQKQERSTCLGDEFSLIEYKASKQPVGLYNMMTEFKQTEIELYDDDTLYLFTDGFADQFGGERGKKYKYKPFKRFLLGLNGTAMDAQKQNVLEEFESWKGDLEQIDDVCVIGVKV